MTFPLLPLAAGGHPLHVHGSTGHWSVWSVDPLVLLAAGAVVLLYALGWLRLRRRGRPDLAGVPRAACFALGIDILVVALISPLNHVGHEYLLSAHMTQHMLIGDVAPLLLVLGVSGPLSLFVIPRPALRALARPRPRAVLRLLGRPWVAFAAWSAVTAGWYVPAAYDFALGSTWGHYVMQLSIIATGLGVWAHIVGTVPHMRMSHARRAGYAVGLLAVGMIVSEVLFLRDPLYSVYVDQPDRLFGLSPAADQIRASLIMTAEQMITLLMAATLLMWTHVDRAVAERDEVAASRA